MIIGPGITVGGGISISHITDNTLITNGLTLNLDAGNSNSYSGSGSTWTDLSTNNANATLYNNPTFAEGPPKRLDFNGTSQYGVVSKVNIVPSTSYTKAAWFFWVGTGVNNNIVSGGTGGHFIFGAGTNRIYCGHANWPNYLVFGSNATISLLTWYYVTLTFNTTDGMALYINGSLDNTYTANKAAHGGNGSVELGAFSTGNFLFGGLSKVHCYNRSLSANEVLQNFNATKTEYGL